MEWFEGLPAELKEAPFFKPGEDGSPREIAQVIADIENAAQHMGNSIRIPGPDADATALTDFRSKAVEKIPGLMITPGDETSDDDLKLIYRSMGQPEKAEGYTIPEEVKMEAELLGQLKARAHAYGMSQAQFGKMVTDMVGDSTTAATASEEAMTTDQAQIKEEWGAAFDTRVNKIAGLLDKTKAPVYLADMIKAGKLPAADLKWLYGMAESLGAEGKEINQHGDQGSGDTTPEEALAQITEIENRSDNALWTTSHPEHARLVKKRTDLMMLAYPDAVTTF